MRQLKKVIIIVVLVLVLQLVKHFLNEHSNAYTYFFNFISCYQLVLLVGCGFTILMEEFLLRTVPKRKAQWISVAALVAIISGCEITCTYWLNHPAKIPSSLFSLFKIYYDDFDCKIIQYNPNYTRYDSSLFYELKRNGRFVFSNREFSDSFYINSSGLRGDEDALRQPEVICVGDSYTLGWGNQQNENYPARIQQITGKKVLNVSMSSYGTAREFMKLQRMDLSAVKCIFWQYCFNDEEENDSYVKHGYSLPVQPEKNFDSVVTLHEWTRKYFPARHFLTILKLGMRKMVFGKAKPNYSSTKPDTESQQNIRAKHFLDIIQKLPIDFSKTRLVIFELSPIPFNNAFTSAVTRLLKNDKAYQEKFRENLVVLDATQFLHKNDYYILDVHIKDVGISKLATVLVEIGGLKPR